MQDFQLFKLREIGSTMSDAFSFIQKDKLLIQKMLTGIIPFYALIGVAMGFMTKEITQITTGLSQKMVTGEVEGEEIFAEMMRQLSAMDYTQVGIIYSIVFLGSIIMSAVSASFAFNYVKARAYNQELSDENVNSFFTKDLGWYIGYTLLLGLVVWGLLLLWVGVVMLGSFVLKGGVGSLLIFLASMSLVVGMIYLPIRYLTLFYAVCFLEDLTFSAALSRAGNLTKGNFWETFGFLLLMGIAVGAISAIVSMTVGRVGLLFGALGAAIFSQVSQYIITGAGAVFMHIAYALWYGNLRYRTEGGSSDGAVSGDMNDLIDEIGKKDF